MVSFVSWSNDLIERRQELYRHIGSWEEEKDQRRDMMFAYDAVKGVFDKLTIVHPSESSETAMEHLGDVSSTAV